MCVKYNLDAEIKSDLSFIAIQKGSSEFRFTDDGSCILKKKDRVASNGGTIGGRIIN
jgi:hypothetical protein